MNKILKAWNYLQARLKEPFTYALGWPVYHRSNPALRDITAQEGFPFNITWPIQP
jgi:hypothetical protein